MAKRTGSKGTGSELYVNGKKVEDVQKVLYVPEKTIIDKIEEIVKKFSPQIIVCPIKGQKDGSQTIKITSGDKKSIPEPVLDCLAEEVFGGIPDHSIEKMPSDAKRFGIASHKWSYLTWCIFLTIPPRFGPEAPQHIRDRINSCLVSNSGFGNWRDNLGSMPTKIYLDGYFRTGEEVRIHPIPKKQTKYYYVKSYRTPGGGLYRLMKEDYSLVSYMQIWKSV